MAPIREPPHYKHAAIEPSGDENRVRVASPPRMRVASQRGGALVPGHCGGAMPFDIDSTLIKMQIIWMRQ
jgi:hypothetical protein